MRPPSHPPDPGPEPARAPSRPLERPTGQPPRPGPSDDRLVTGAAALVLAGGASRRMGRPKPFLRVGGRDLLERALETAAAVCPRIVLIGSEAARCRRAAFRYGWRSEAQGSRQPTARDTLRRGPSRLRIAEDRRPGLGPLAGLETARFAGPSDAERWWILAVDLPFAPATLGRRLLAELRAWEEEEQPRKRGIERGEANPRGRAVLAAGGGHLQPLCGAYSARALEVASTCLDAEIRAVSSFLERLRLRSVSLPESQGWWLLNVNTEEELRVARARARAEA